MQGVKLFLRDCLWLLWMVFFRPKSLLREVEQFDRRRRWRLVAQGLVITTVTPFLLTTLTGLLLERLAISFNFAKGLSVVAFYEVASVTLSMAYGISVGLISGMRDGAVRGVSVGVALGMVFCVAFSVMPGVARSVALGIADDAAGGVAGSVTLGVPLGVALGVVGSVILRVASGIAIGIAVGGAISVVLGMVFALADGLMFGVAFLVGYFRLFLLPFEAINTLWSLFRARKQSQGVAQFLRQSIAYRDEAMLLPQPFLTPLLVLMGEQDRDELLRAVAYMTTSTFQRRAAVNALLELTRRDLLRCRTLDEIAQVGQNLGWLTPHLRIVHEVYISDRLTLSGSLRVATRDEVNEQSSPESAPTWREAEVVRQRPHGMLPIDAIEAFRKGGAQDAVEQCQRVSTEVAAALSSTSNYHKLTALNRARRQLDDLRQFAVIGLRGRESQVFAQVAQQWLDAVNAEIDRLTEEERVAERIPNPYVAPRPLSPDLDAVFVGRNEAFRFVEEHFLRADQNVPIVLYGQPRIGKSSVLRYFPDRLTTNLIPVYVDMQRSAQVESTGGLLFNLADTVGQEITRRGVSVPVPPLSDYAAEPFIVFGKFLDAVETAIHAPENRVILALDEFEEIERKLTEGKVSRDLMPFLRNMMQHRQGIALLFAGTHTLSEMVQDLWIPYFRSAVPCKVSYLNEADARQLITNPIEDFPLDYEPEAVERLLQATHYHPCLIQLTCSALVDLKNEQKSRHASVEDVNQALTKALESGDYVFHGIWEWIPSHEREALAALAAEGQATVGQLVSALHGSEGEVQRTVQRLTDAEVIEVVTDGNGQPACRFQVELFRRWVERHAARVGVSGQTISA